MAIRFSGIDELGRLLENPARNQRHDIWLWLNVHRHVVELPPETCGGETMRRVIATALSGETNFIEAIPEERDHLLLPDELLRWIKTDERQNDWLSRRLEPHTGRLPDGLIRLTGRNRIIAMIDYWDAHAGAKELKLRRIKEEWIRHSALDTLFEWFKDKKDGPQRCICAWEWLEKNYLNKESQELPIRTYDELLSYFDRASASHFEKKAMIQEIKQRWNRRQFDERNAHKRQVNVLLPMEVIDLLDGFATAHRMGRAQVVEVLLKTEAVEGSYLGKPK